MSQDIKPILIVMTSHGSKGEGGDPTGFFLSEVTHPLAVFEAADLPTEFASIQGGEPPVDGFDLDDETNARYWNDSQFRERLRHTRVLAEVKPEDYSAIFFAGGHGAMWDFPESQAVNDKTRAIWEQGGVVGAVCHGPAALVNVTLSDGTYLVAGRQVAGFTNSEEEAVGLTNVVPFLLASQLAERGAVMQAGDDWTSKVVTDERLVTGQNPQSATGVGEAMRDRLTS